MKMASRFLVEAFFWTSTDICVCHCRKGTVFTNIWSFNVAFLHLLTCDCVWVKALVEENYINIWWALGGSRLYNLEHQLVQLLISRRVKQPIVNALLLAKHRWMLPLERTERKTGMKERCGDGEIHCLFIFMQIYSNFTTGHLSCLSKPSLHVFLLHSGDK